MVGWFSRRLRRNREDGAALVEFAFVLPFLMLVLMGIVEFGWTFAQHLDVRHGAREAGRLAMVNQTSADIRTQACAGDATCSRAPLASGTSNVSISYDNVDDTATVTVKQTYSSLTGLIDFFDGLVQSTVVMRYERDDPPTWSTLTDSDCP